MKRNLLLLLVLTITFLTSAVFAKEIVSSASTDKSTITLFDDGTIDSSNPTMPGFPPNDHIIQLCATHQYYAALDLIGQKVIWWDDKGDGGEIWTPAVVSLETTSDRNDFIIHYNDGSISIPNLGFKKY